MILKELRVLTTMVDGYAVLNDPFFLQKTNKQKVIVCGIDTFIHCNITEKKEQIIIIIMIIIII